MAKRVLGADIEPKCAYCAYCVLTENKRTALCEHRGLTSPDGACKKFSYDATKRVPRRPTPHQIFKEEDFTI